MKKFYFFIASLFIAIGAMAQVEFTFTRGNASATVTTTGADGASATITATAPKANASTNDGLWNTGGVLATLTDVLCTMTNTTNATADAPIVYTLTVTGLEAGQEFNQAVIVSKAFNGGGAYQSYTETRHCNFILLANDIEVGSKTDESIMIANGGEKTITFDENKITANENGEIVLTLKIWKGTTNGGCFYGLTRIKLSNNVDVTYQYTFNGECVKEATVTQVIGSDFEAPAIDYVTFTYPDGTVTAETTTVEVTCTQNLPFTVSTSYTDATWYYMSIRSNDEKWVARSESAPYTNSKTKTTDDNGLWAFMGNVFDGIQVINKGADEGYTLGYAGTDTGSNIYMMEGTTSWIIEEGNGGFLLRQVADYVYAHDYGSKLQIWNSSAAPTDAGSAFKVYDPANNSTSVAALQAAIDAANAKSAYIGTEIGLYTYTGEGNYADAIAGYQTYLDGITSTATPTPDEVDAKTAELNNLVSSSLTLNVPATGKYYRLKNVVNNRYMSANESSVTVIDDGGEVASTIFYLGEDNTLLSYTQGRYLDCNAKNLAAVGTSYSGVFAAAYGTPATNVITYKNNGYWTFGARNNEVSIDRGSSTPDQAGYNWTIEEVTVLPVAVSAAGVATFYTPVALTFPTNVECYYINSAIDEKGIVQLTPIDNVVPAGNGIVIKAGEGTHNFTIGGEATEITGNLLEGTSAATYINKEAYVLANGENGVGLYKAALSDGAFLNNANKAYFVPTTAALAGYSFSFDWAGTTGIEGVEAEGTQNGKIYDITGREVKAITAPGIYIVNGRKVVK